MAAKHLAVSSNGAYAKTEIAGRGRHLPHFWAGLPEQTKLHGHMARIRDKCFLKKESRL